MCDIDVFSPEGYQMRMVVTQELLKMTVGCFIEELAKLFVVVYAFSEYLKTDVRLIIGNKPLDDSAPMSDYKITPGTKMQLVRKVHGG